MTYDPYQPPQASGPPPLPPGYQHPKTSGMAVASMILGIVGLVVCILLAILAVIFGHLALSEIKRSNGMLKGRGMAIAGLICGYLGLAFSLGMILFAILVSSPTPTPTPTPWP